MKPIVFKYEFVRLSYLLYERGMTGNEAFNQVYYIIIELYITN